MARRRRRRRRGGTRGFGGREWPKWMRLDPCAYCGKRPAGTLDHIDARTDGGPLRFENLTAACAECNGQKGSTPLLHYLLRRRGIGWPPHWRVRSWR